MRWFGLLVVASLVGMAGAQSWPVTRAEKSDYAETSHYSDVVDFLRRLQAAGGPVSVHEIGTSTDGKAMPLAIASFPPVASAAEARRLGKPIVYIQANIHAGEVEGKEAALIVLRRLCQAGPKGLLGKIVLLITPIYNIDGNEKFGPVAVNRPEQDGPILVGLRPNGQGLDLNRDAIKAEAPETRAVLDNVYKTWDPDVMMDLHTTDGTRHGYELTYAPPLNPNTEPEIYKFTRDVLLTSIRKELKAKFGMETFDYGNTEHRTGKDRAWYTFGQEGRYCTNYVGLRNRISVLSEATTYIPFKDRIVATDRFVTSILDYVAAHSKQIVDMTKGADAKVVAWGQKPADAPPLGVRFDFDLRGTETTLLERPLPAGTPAATGRPAAIDKVSMPVFDRFKIARTALFPAAYLIPASETATLKLLRQHGVLLERLTEAWHGPVSQFTVTGTHIARSAFQGHKLVLLDGTFAATDQTIEAGWFVVRTAQPLGILAFHILEPESDDGAVTWGFCTATAEKSVFPVLKSFQPVLAASVVSD
jgi:hypothetical protein